MNQIDVYASRLAIHSHTVLLVLVVLFCDSDRVGRGERSRASDACEMRMRLLAWTERISCAEALPCSAAENSSPLSLRLYIRYGSSISISIDLSLIHGISVVTVAVADGENPVFRPRAPCKLQYLLTRSRFRALNTENLHGARSKFSVFRRA